MEDNKQLVSRFYEAIQRQDFDAVADMCHPDFVFYHQMDTPHHGAQGFIDAEARNFAAFRNFKFPVHLMIAEGEKVAAYMTFEGDEQIGVTCGVEPTGRPLRFSLLMLLTIADGKIIEKRAHFDRLDIVEQLSDPK